MSYSGAELLEQLKDAGTALLDPPSSTDELLNLLDRVEDLLTNVEQAPSRSVQEALLPTMKALISNKLLRHSEMEVKVSVVSCITEITRITAPDAPYNDDQMKEIFQLTVTAFEKLSHVSGRCYTKAVSILDIVAKVRSSLMMLDLECDALVLEMFQHFFKHIRPNHPDAVFSAMEAVMTVVLDESEEIPLNLLSLLLASVKKENQNISPISWKLGENVITNCVATLKPYIMEAVKLLGIDLDDYSPILVSICQNGTEDIKHKSVNDSGDDLENENKLVKKTASNEPSQKKKGLAKTEQTADGITKSINKCTAPTRNDDNDTNKNASQKLQRGRLIKHPKRDDSKGIAEPNSSLTRKADKSKSEPESIRKKRGWKSNPLMNTEEGYPKRADLKGIVEPNNSLSTKANKSEHEPDSISKKKPRKQNSVKNLEEGDPKRAYSRGVAEPNSSLTKKAKKSENDPDSVPIKRGQKPNSLINSEEGHPKGADSRAISAPNISLSIKADKSESEPGSVPKKRGRKPNSLMNPEEGYDHSWICSGRKSLGSACRRRSDEKIINNSPSGNSVSKKATSSSILENVTEPAVLQSELDEIGASPSKDRNLPDPNRGHLKRKGNTLNQEVSTKSPSVLKEELLSAQVEEKTPKSIYVNLKKEPQDANLVEEKEQGQSTKLGLAVKSNEEPAVASGDVTAQQETKVPCHPEEKLQQQSTVKLEAADINDCLSVRRDTKKRKSANDSSNEDTNEDSGHKIISSGIKSPNGNGSYLEKSSTAMSKRTRIIGKEQASETAEPGGELVGSRIKVWWPLDKTYYEGVVHSYDPVKRRHKVSYVDGDEETLNLKKQRWELIEHGALTDEGERSDLPRLDASSDMNSEKEELTTKVDQEKQAENLDQVKQEKDDSSSKSDSQKGQRKTRSNQEKQAKKSDQGKADSPSERNPLNRMWKAKSAQKQQEKDSDQAKQAEGDPSSEKNRQKRIRITKSGQKKQAEANPSSERKPLKRSRKAKLDHEQEVEKSDQAKQAEHDPSSERIEMAAPVSNVETTKSDTKSADTPQDNPDIKDEPMDDDGMRMDGEPKDDGQISAGNLEAAGALKTGSDCTQTAPEAIAMSKRKIPEADAESGGEECANKLVEMSNVAKKGRFFSSSAP